jgi:hypothetical protein
MVSSHPTYLSAAAHRYFGRGTHVTRSIYKFPDTYYVLSQVVLSKDQKHGAAIGTLVWRGRAKASPQRIGAALKREWKVVKFPDYHTAYRGKQQPLEDASLEQK